MPCLPTLCALRTVPTAVRALEPPRDSPRRVGSGSRSTSGSRASGTKAAVSRSTTSARLIARSSVAFASRLARDGLRSTCDSSTTAVTIARSSGFPQATRSAGGGLDRAALLGAVATGGGMVSIHASGDEASRSTRSRRARQLLRCGRVRPLVGARLPTEEEWESGGRAPAWETRSATNCRQPHRSLVPGPRRRARPRRAPSGRSATSGSGPAARIRPFRVFARSTGAGDKQRQFTSGQMTLRGGSVLLAAKTTAAPTYRNFFRRWRVGR